MGTYFIIMEECSPSGHLVQSCSQCLAQRLMNLPSYFTIVDVAIVLLGLRRWRRSNIITITLR